MRTEASWNQQQENLKAARVLAAFLDLQPSEFDEFRKKYWTFMPLLTVPTQFQMQLQKVWQGGFRQKEVLEVLSSNDMMGGGRITTTTIDTETGKLDQETQSVKEYEQGLTYKKAVLFLFTDTWRAKICRHCSDHFIAEKNGARFCSPPCATEYRDSYKAKNWEKHKDALNARRRKAYEKMRSRLSANRNRRSHAKRKSLH
jgi:hypothetical protein